MKNIEAILTEAGITLSEDQKTAINKAVTENYRTVSDYDKQKDKLTAAEEKVKATEDALKAFDGVDVEASKKQIADLQEALTKKEVEYQAQIADRDFQEMLKTAISESKGKNSKAIAALLDMEKLKGSKNQKEDIAAALKTLTEAEDSKMLFGEPEPNPVGTGNIIGEVRKPSGNTEDAAMRAAMGLPPVAEQK